MKKINVGILLIILFSSIVFTSCNKVQDELEDALFKYNGMYEGTYLLKDEKTEKSFKIEVKDLGVTSGTVQYDGKDVAIHGTTDNEKGTFKLFADDLFTYAGLICTGAIAGDGKFTFKLVMNDLIDDKNTIEFSGSGAKK